MATGRCVLSTALDVLDFQYSNFLFLFSGCSGDIEAADSPTWNCHYRHASQGRENSCLKRCCEQRRVYVEVVSAVFQRRFGVARKQLLCANIVPITAPQRCLFHRMPTGTTP